MNSHYITKLHRQHTTVVTSIPRPVQRALEVQCGDHLIFQVSERSRFVQISKVEPQGEKNAGNNRNSGSEDQGG